MLIELKENDYKLIRKIESANSTSYGVLEVQGNYYINVNDLFSLIDDIQDNREYAEDKLQQVIDDYEERLKDNNPNIVDVIWYKEQLTKAHEENENLKEENEILRDKALMVCNEDMLDRLAFEGVEI